jgi:hypothetical protein
MLNTTLRIIQANVNKSAQATESLLEYAIQSESDIILIQEPWIFKDKTTQFKDCRSINHSSFRALIPLHDKQTRPRTLVYTSRLLQIQGNPLFSEPDCQSFEVRDTEEASLQVVNPYNEKDRNGIWTVDKCLFNFTLLPESLVLADFNIRYRSWDPTSQLNFQREDDLFNWIENSRQLTEFRIQQLELYKET